MRRMTQPAPGELPDEELVLRAALADRERQRSGKAMRVQAVTVLVFVVVACWLVFVVGRIPHAGYAGIGLGVTGCVIALLVVVGRAGLSPKLAWGNPVRGPCPRCGQRAMREDRAIHWEAPRAGSRAVGGLVTFCMADGCQYTAVRKVRQWPAGRRLALSSRRRAVAPSRRGGRAGAWTRPRSPRPGPCSRACRSRPSAPWSRRTGR